MIKINSRLIVSIAVLAVCFSLENVDGTKYSLCDGDCRGPRSKYSGKSKSEVKNVIISDCETLDETCPFVRGFNKTIEVDFTPKQKAEQVIVKVAGKLSTLPVPFHVNPDNACGNYGFDCPLEADKPYKFKLTLPIMRTYPKINVDVFLRLVDESGNIITCIEMPARIQEPLKE